MTQEDPNSRPYSEPPAPTPYSDPNMPPPPAPVSGSPMMGYDSAAGPIETNKDARMWGMLAHLSALVGLLSIPPVVGPLVVWLVKRNEHAFVDDQGKEALNFQITMFIALLISGALICVGIGLILLPIVGIVDLIFVIIAAVKANNGERYRYPFNIRLVT
jgi:uncharacterized Tic20 family protein